MKKDIFDTITLPDMFDKVKLDLIDSIELETEEKVIYSDEMKKLLIEEIHNKISNIPIGKILTSVIGKEFEKSNKLRLEDSREVDKKLSGIKEEIKKEFSLLKEEFDKFIKETKKKIASLSDEVFSPHPRYEFGGYSPLIDLNGIPHLVEVDYDADGQVKYVGLATPGSSTSNNVWQIKLLTYSGDDNITTVSYAGGTTGFDKKWDERTTYTYS